jgi:hypothetical protein
MDLAGQLRMAASQARLPSCFGSCQALAEKLLFKKSKMGADLAFELCIRPFPRDQVP